jgi:dTDP-4-dehydrorhamnose reductase
LLTGASGQLGRALLSTRPSNIDLIALSRAELDQADHAFFNLTFEKYRPDWVLNAGAYTAVDKAEREPELAKAINAVAPAAFVKSLQSFGGCLCKLGRLWET